MTRSSSGELSQRHPAATTATTTSSPPARISNPTRVTPPSTPSPTGRGERWAHHYDARGALIVYTVLDVDSQGSPLDTAFADSHCGGDWNANDCYPEVLGFSFDRDAAPTPSGTSTPLTSTHTPPSTPSTAGTPPGWPPLTTLRAYSLDHGGATASSLPLSRTPGPMAPAPTSRSPKDTLDLGHGSIAWANGLTIG